MIKKTLNHLLKNLLRKSFLGKSDDTRDKKSFSKKRYDKKDSESSFKKPFKKKFSRKSSEIKIRRKKIFHLNKTSGPRKRRKI